MCEAIGAPELIDRPGFATASERSANRDELNAALEAVFVTKPGAEWIAILNDVGVPCGSINRIDEVFADPQVQHLGMARKGPSHVKGETAFVSQPIQMSRTDWEITQPPPEAGEHSTEILAELGYDKAAIDDLSSRRII